MVKKRVKINRNSRLLSFYKQLLSGKKISKQLFIDEYGINERTFERDVSEIRNFLSDSFANEELIYDREDNVYYLHGLSQSNLDKYDVMVICKILVGNNFLSKEEMEDLIERLLSVIDKYDLLDVVPIIHDDLNQYCSNNAKVDLKMIEDLIRVLKSNKSIAINVANRNQRRIRPKKIELKNSQFILSGYTMQDPREIIEIKVSDILDFKILR